MESWERFVQRTLRDLLHGAKIPKYFGCLADCLVESNRDLLIKEEEEQEVEPEPNVEQELDPQSEPEEVQAEDDYVKHFRDVGDSILRQYWYAIETSVPRMSENCKFMKTFQISKFDRWKKRLEAQEKEQLEKGHQIVFTVHEGS